MTKCGKPSVPSNTGGDWTTSWEIDKGSAELRARRAMTKARTRGLGDVVDVKTNRRVCTVPDATGSSVDTSQLVSAAANAIATAEAELSTMTSKNVWGVEIPSMPDKSAALGKTRVEDGVASELTR